MTTEAEQLLQIRQQIDTIDEQIQQLITERALCAKQVADIKTQGGQVEAVFYRPEREAQVLRAVKQRNTSVLSDDDMARLFREIMSACLALEQPLKVAYLGPEGSYTHAAVLKQFGSFAQPVPVSTIEDVFKVVATQQVDYGVVPLENSTEGAVTSTQDCLISTPVTVTGEVELPIHHCLLGQSTQLHDITKVLAHPQALGQCRTWLRNNLPGVQLEAVDSNALAAKMAQAHTEVAAIASEQAASLYQLNILKSHIEDAQNNTTKFWIIGRHAPTPSGEDKTALILSLANEAGALSRILESFAKRNISMTRIVSRPAIEQKWEYLFYIDITGHQQDPAVAEALAEVQANARFFKLLGSYPVSPLN
ncbi:prephenate dehydratase [Thiomicrospira sp. ALE5]|uniref:prephenate dehydratase n=1 Tax=Thiomicrospira sp. ALE5 TaxID=748650 RepID=UPI0008DEB439|nr:prephenate dehydratase [Thiomicrospira sp. ALE5]SFR49812.1 chorismate mutase [Thiomicrospira sp. ALE5]